MCKFFSGIVCKDRLVYDLDNDSHEVLLEKTGFNDDKPFPNFVRVELLPQDDDIFNHDLKNWKLRVDQDRVPDWFDKSDAEKKMLAALKKVFKERFIINSDEWEERRNQRIFVKKSKVKLYNCRAVLWESSSAVLRESSSAVLWESSSAELRESSSAVLWESSSAVLRESSSAVLWGSSSKIKNIFDDASVKDLSGDVPKIIVANPKIKLEFWKEKK